MRLLAVDFVIQLCRARPTVAILAPRGQPFAFSFFLGFRAHFFFRGVGCSYNYVHKVKQSIGTPKEVFEKEENKKQFNRSKILQSADKLVSKDRADEHGEAMHNFVAIGDLWNAYLGLNNFITPQDVPMMLALLKMARTKENPDNADNYRDLCGYGALAGEVSRNK